MSDEIVVVWRADVSGLSCRIWAGVDDEKLNAIREEIIVAMQLPREDVVIISRHARPRKPWPRIILIRREPLPLSLRDEHSVARQMLRDIVMKHLIR